MRREGKNDSRPLVARTTTSYPETLLIVDDDKSMLELEVCILSQLGHRVLEAEGPVEAMRLAAVTPTIHLLLTDFSMPEANGLELTRRFRIVHPKTPVLMVSGSLEAFSGQADDLEHFGVLAKPFTPADLVHRVDTLLSHSAIRDAVACP